MDQKPPRLYAQFDVTWKSLFRIAVVVLLAYLAILLWPLFKLFVLASLISVALYPIVTWLCRKGWSRTWGLLAATMALLLLVAGTLGLIAPVVVRQASALSHDLPVFREQVLKEVHGSDLLSGIVQDLLDQGTVTNSQKFVGKAIEMAQMTFGGLFDFALVLVFAIYLMIEGPRIIAWLIVLFPKRHRSKMEQTMTDFAQLVFAYAAGQFITSALCATYVAVVLMILGVPMALLLGILAGVFDILPVVGFILTIIPALVLSLTVSPTTALLVFLLYGAYHLFENYFIVPRIYGSKLRLSTFVVLISVLAAFELAGVVGAITILPFVAAYPVLERLWLASKVEPDALREHE